jgi:hypothetical protein
LHIRDIREAVVDALVWFMCAVRRDTSKLSFTVALDFEGGE